MENTKKRQDKKLSVKILGILLSVCLIVAMLPPMAAAEDTAALAEDANRRLLNGSFEEEQTWTDSYQQLDQSKVPYWNTTAYNPTVIELLRENKKFVNRITADQVVAGTYVTILKDHHVKTVTAAIQIVLTTYMK